MSTNPEHYEAALKKLLDCDSPYGHCRTCNALALQESKEILKALMNCINCLIDIRSKGEWNSAGVMALKKAYELSPNKDKEKWETIFRALGYME